MNTRDKAIHNFRSQALDSVERLKADLPNFMDADKSKLNVLFRSLRSIKRSAFLLNFISVSHLSLQLETILILILDEKLKASNNLQSLLSKGLNALSVMLQLDDTGENYDLSALFEESAHILKHEKILSSNNAAQDSLQQDIQDITAQLLYSSKHLEKNERKSFGQFLIEKNYLGSEQVFTALVEQENQKIADLQAFLELGISVQHCLTIANVSRLYMLHPMRVAKEMGYITTKDIHLLNTKIQNSRPPIGKILHNLKYCDTFEIKLWLQEYYDYCNDICPDNSIHPQLAEHRQFKATLTEKGLIDRPNTPQNNKALATEPDHKKINFAGSIVNCSESLLREFQNDTTNDQYENIESLILSLETSIDTAEKEASIQSLGRLINSLKDSADLIGAKGSKNIAQQIENVLTTLQVACENIDSGQWENVVNILLKGIDLFWGLRDTLISNKDENIFIKESTHKINTFIQELAQLQETASKVIALEPK